MKGKFLGYSVDTGSPSTLLLLDNGKIVRSRDVVFRPSQSALKSLNPSSTIPTEWQPGGITVEECVQPECVDDSVVHPVEAPPVSSSVAATPGSSSVDVTVNTPSGAAHTYFNAQNNAGAEPVDVESVLCEDVYVVVM